MLQPGVGRPYRPHSEFYNSQDHLAVNVNGQARQRNNFQFEGIDNNVDTGNLTIIVDNDRAKMAVGGAGGPTIISGTLQVMLNVLDFKLHAQEASSALRIHHQWTPPTLSYERDIPRDVVEGLERRGHKTQPREHITTVNVVVRSEAGFEGASEFRAGGAPAGY
jgi:gamma-glutamyltranspeptidase